MSISLEALAMSGANYLEGDLDVEKWEQMESEVPLHLLADDKEDNGKDEEQEKDKMDFEYFVPYLLWCFENKLTIKLIVQN